MFKASHRYDVRGVGSFHSVDTVTSWSDIIHCVSVRVSALEISFKVRHDQEQMYSYVVQAQNIVPDMSGP